MNETPHSYKDIRDCIEEVATKADVDALKLEIEGAFAELSRTMVADNTRVIATIVVAVLTTAFLVVAALKLV